MLSRNDASSTASQSDSHDERRHRDSRLNLRLANTQLDSIRRAAAAREKTVTEFVLDCASVAAEQVLADRRWFRLNEEAWDSFDALLERPVVFKPRLSALMAQEDPFVD